MKEVADESAMATAHNLVGGHFAPRWLYFNFYQLCRRQQRFPGRNLSPTLNAWNALGAVMAMPWLALILLADHYVPFLRPLGQVWVALHLPGAPEKAWGYVLTVIGIATGLILLGILFGGRYEKIMREFARYDHSKHDLAPGIMFFPVWAAMIGVSVHALIVRTPSSLLGATLANICIFIAAEIVFRIWWRWWLQSHRE